VTKERKNKGIKIGKYSTKLPLTRALCFLCPRALFYFIDGVLDIVQAGIELLGSNNSPTSAS
jgi:hypothetical protein